MTFLPIVGRELRVAARRPSTYWVRTVAALAILALAGWFLIMLQYQGSRQSAMTLFSVTTGIALLYALFSGVTATADCISQEKRDGTLGLLFLTDLKGYDIVLGKLVSSSVSSFYAVFAILPILAVPLLMGGITFSLFGKVALVVLNTLFLSLCVGIWASAMCRQLRKAMGLTAFTMLLIAGGLPALSGWLNYSTMWPTLQRLLLLPSPGFAYWRAYSGIAGMAMPINEYWISMGVIHSLGWLCLVIASVVVPRSWQDRPVGDARLSWRRFLLRPVLWSREDAAAFRRRLLEVNPFYWLAARARLKPALVWGVICLLAAAWFWGLWEFKDDWLNEGVYIFSGIVLNTLFKGWFGGEAGRQLLEERQQGTMELLLSTPISVRQILQGQRLELQRQFLGPVALVLFIEFLFLVIGRAEFSSRNDLALWVSLWITSMFFLVADLVALYWVGMWQCMVNRSANRASQNAVSRILVFPWVSWAVIMMLLAVASFGSNFNPEWEFLLGLYIFLSLVTDLGFALYARQRLLNDFREAATRRFDAPRGFWRTLLGQ